MKELPLVLSILLILVSCSKEPESIKVTGVTVSPSSLSLTEGETGQLSVSVSPTDASDKSVVWSSSNSSIVSVDSNGKISALKEGSATITATSTSVGKSGSCSVVVEPKIVAVESIMLNKHEIALEKGGSETLEFTITPSNATDKSVTWTSSDTSVATVEDGTVLAIAPGLAEITVKSGNVTDKCQVSVFVHATGITLNANDITLDYAQSFTLTATLAPDDATDIIEWSSSDETVATVKDGIVTGVGAGVTTVIAKAGAYTAECVVNITLTDIIDLGLSIKWSAYNLGASKPDEYGDYYAWGETEPYYANGCSQDNPCNDWKDGKASGYHWSSYKFGSGTFIKYCNADDNYFWNSSGSPDGKIVLDLDDDAAHVALGGDWRMPTYAEWTELKEDCSWEWQMVNGIYGWSVTGPNGKSIFLPVAGNRRDLNLNDTGATGSYWSSSLDSQHSYCGVCIVMWSGNVYFEPYHRYVGCTIRPVTE